MRITLKEYFECKDYEKSEKILRDYCKKLKEQGWRWIIIEGGYVPPEGAIIFSESRSPYEGQILQYCGDEEKYIEAVVTILKTGDFVIEEDLRWLEECEDWLFFKLREKGYLQLMEKYEYYKDHSKPVFKVKDYKEFVQHFGFNDELYDELKPIKDETGATWEEVFKNGMYEKNN